MATKIKGMDISYWQGSIDFKKVAADGIKFVVLRDGYRKTLDSRFVEYVKGCQNNGIYVMAYHFIYTDGATPKQNAQSSYDNLKAAGLDPTKTWIAADLEYDTWTKNGEKCTKAKCTQYTKEYLDALKALGCNKLFIYTNQDYYKNYYDWSQLKYPVWLADYEGDPNYDCVMQQYTSSGKVNGISGNVDMDWLFDASMMSDNTSTTTEEITKKETETMIEVTADRVIAVAKAEVGYKEKASNANLDDKTANAGSANYTKYARDFDQKYPNWYNGKKNGFAWCDMFVDWCFLTAFGYQKALELLCQPEKSAGAGCTYSYNYYKNKGQVGTTPKVGAQIFFGSPGNFSHTGLVYKFDNSYVYTIEGNTSDQVAYRQYSRSKSNIYYGYPNYSGTIKESDAGTDIPTSTGDGNLTLGMTGAAVETMQKMLIKLGYSCGSAGADGSFGNNTLTALKKFQQANGLTVDGIYGPKSKAKLTELYAAATKSSSSTNTTTKTTEEIAKEVINGKWGNGDERKKKLEAAGYNYRTIQDKVNELVGGGSTTTTSTETNTTVKVDYAQSFSKSIAKTYTTTTRLRLRAGASTSKDVITIMPKGAKVTCYGYYTGNWYYVKYNNLTGFCAKEYLK